MKKWLIFFSLFILLVTISFSTYLYVNRQAFAEQCLSRLFGAQAHVEKISWSKKAVHFRCVSLANPCDDKLKLAFSCPKITIKITLEEQLACLFGYRPVSLSTIYLTKPVFTISEAASNWKALIGYAASHRKNSGREFFLKSVILKEVGIADAKHARKRPRDLKEVRLTSFATGSPVYLDELIFQMTTKSLRAITARLENQELLHARPQSGL